MTIWLRGGGTPNTGIGVMADGNINITGTATGTVHLILNTGELLFQIWHTATIKVYR